MPSSQFNDSTPATQANQDWEEIEYPPRATSEPLAPHQGWGDEGLGFGPFAPTSPGYSGPSESELDERQQEAVRNMKHPSMSWTACYDDGCQIHLRDKEGASWFPREPRTNKKTPSPPAPPTSP